VLPAGVEMLGTPASGAGGVRLAGTMPVTKS
jgi:hypothetical protein